MNNERPPGSEFFECPTLEEVRRFIPQTSNQVICQEDMAQGLQLVCQRFGARLTPYSLWSIVRVRETDYGELELAGRTITCNTRFFWGASAAALILSFVETAIEEEQRKLTESDETQALILRAVLLAGLERECKEVRKAVKNKVQPEGMELGYSLRPGCQLIPLDISRLVLEVTNAEKYGIRFNESTYALEPATVIATIIPLGINLAYVSETGQACELCGQGTRCPNRQN